MKLGWRQLPEEYRPRLLALAQAVAKGQALHAVWSSCLDEVELVLREASHE